MLFRSRDSHGRSSLTAQQRSLFVRYGRDRRGHRNFFRREELIEENEKGRGWEKRKEGGVRCNIGSHFARHWVQGTMDARNVSVTENTLVNR